MHDLVDNNLATWCRNQAKLVHLELTTNAWRSVVLTIAENCPLLQSLRLEVRVSKDQNQRQWMDEEDPERIRLDDLATVWRTMKQLESFTLSMGKDDFDTTQDKLVQWSLNRQDGKASFVHHGEPDLKWQRVGLLNDDTKDVDLLRAFHQVVDVKVGVAMANHYVCLLSTRPGTRSTSIPTTSQTTSGKT